MSQTSEMVIIIRPSFKKVCGPDACRAGVYNHILYRLAKKAKNEPEKDVREGNIFWFASAEDICQDIDEAWCVNKVRKEIKQLVDAGLLGQRHNPIKKWDRKFQYFLSEEQGKKLLEKCEAEGVCLLHIGLNAEVLHLLHMVNAFNKNGGCICQKEEMELPNMGNASTIYGGAIPEGSQPKGSTEGSLSEEEGESNSDDTPKPPGVSSDTARAEYPLITFAHCLSYLQEQGVAPRGEDAVQVMVQARILYAHKHPRYEYRARPGLSEHPDDQLPSKQNEQVFTDAPQGNNHATHHFSLPHSASTPGDNLDSAPCQEHHQSKQALDSNDGRDQTPTRRDVAQVAQTPTTTMPAQSLSPSPQGLQQAALGTVQQVDQNGGATILQEPEKPNQSEDQKAAKQSTKAKKATQPKPETPKGPPIEPPADMAWSTRKCLMWFDFWRGGILIGKFKLMQASTCAKGLSEQFDEQTVIQARGDMEADPYYAAKGGCDVCDVANNIHKYIKRHRQQNKPKPAQVSNPNQPITNIRELVKQREALRAAAVATVGV